MDWEEFVKHPDIENTRRYLLVSPEKYLFGKILHDVLECLNMHLAASEFLLQTSLDISDDFMNWLSKWNPVIRDWKNEVTDFWEGYETLDSETNWPDLIGKVGKVPDKISTVELEAGELQLPTAAEQRFMVNVAVQNIITLHSLISFIRNEEYLLLWRHRHDPSRK